MLRVPVTAKPNGETQGLTRLAAVVGPAGRGGDLQFANMGHPSQRKLNCFALTVLLETNQPWILQRLQDLMIVWSDVVTELRDEDGSDE